MKYIYCLSLILALSNCKKGSSEVVDNGGTITVTGTLQPQGATFYQYGTHTIKNIDQYFALKSSAVNLNDYNNKNVTITGNKIPGYPIEGGPALLEVKSIKLF